MRRNTISSYQIMSELVPNSPSEVRTRYSVLRTQYSVPSTLTSSIPPSRNTNPFATCWTRPGALPFRFPAGESAEQLVARLATNGWWGEIVGPHGCGKSTLLAALLPALRDAGCSIRVITLRDGQRRLPRGWHAQSPSDGRGKRELRRPRPSLDAQGRATPPCILVIDGYEQLGWLQRLLLKRRCRRAAAGLLVTSHSPTGLPTLITLAPDLPLIQQLVATLCERAATRITPADVVASHAGRGSNVRDIFFDLYDRHERLRSAD